MRSPNFVFPIASWLLAFVTLSSEASTVLFENPYVGNPQSWTSDVAREREVAEDFTLSNAADVFSIAWYGAFDFNVESPKDFRISIYGDSFAGGRHLPTTTPLHRISLDDITGIRTPNNLPLRYDAVLPVPIRLSAGIYWLSVQGNDFSNSSGAFAWSHGNPQGSVLPETVFRSGTNWEHRADNDRSHQAFQIAGIPEPSTLALFAIGCAAIGCRRRRYFSAA